MRENITVFTTDIQCTPLFCLFDCLTWLVERSSWKLVLMKLPFEKHMRIPQNMKYLYGIYAIKGGLRGSTIDLNQWVEPIYSYKIS